MKDALMTTYATKAHVDGIRKLKCSGVVRMNKSVTFAIDLSNKTDETVIAFNEYGKITFYNLEPKSMNLLTKVKIRLHILKLKIKYGEKFVGVIGY